MKAPLLWPTPPPGNRGALAAAVRHHDRGGILVIRKGSSWLSRRALGWLALASLAHLEPHADIRQAGLYALTAEVLDGGGRHSVAGLYAQDVSVGGSPGAIITQDFYTIACNYINQLNDAPAPGEYILYGEPGEEAQFALSGLLAAASDAEGDAFTINSLDSVSALGGRVLQEGSFVVYEPPAGRTEPDSFNYTLKDDFGNISWGRVSVMILVDPESILVDFEVSGGARIVFDGHPGQPYRVQASDSLRLPIVWFDLPTREVPGQPGLFRAIDPNGATAPQRFYRTLNPLP